MGVQRQFQLVRLVSQEHSIVCERARLVHLDGARVHDVDMYIKKKKKKRSDWNSCHTPLSLYLHRQSATTQIIHYFQMPTPIPKISPTHNLELTLGGPWSVPERHLTC